MMRSMRTLLALLVLAPLASAQEAFQKPNIAFPALLAAPKTAIVKPADIRSIPQLGSILLSLNAPVQKRTAAALQLGRVGNWRAAVYLKTAMKDSSKEVRFASALALGKIKGADTISPLINALQLDPEWWVRFAAASALGENRDPRSVVALGVAAENEKEWQVRMQAVRSLGQVGSRDAVYALSKPLKDSDASVRAAAALALGQIGGPDAASLLAEALHAERAELPRKVMTEQIKRLLSR
jgi:HEAT repeat protein